MELQSFRGRAEEALKLERQDEPRPQNQGRWEWLKIKQEGQTAGFGPCFHLPGFQFGIGFLSHSQMKDRKGQSQP